MLRHMRRLSWLIACVAIAACSREAPRTPGAFEPSLAVVEQGFMLAWYGYTDASAEIFMQRADERGTPLGSPLRLTVDAADSFEPDIVPIGSEVAIAWYDKDRETKQLAPQLGVWSTSGELRWRTSLDSSGRNPVVRAHGDRLFAAWIAMAQGAHGVHARWFEQDGTPASDVLVLGEASWTTWNLNAAIDASGRAAVVFDAKVDTQSNEIFLATVADGEIDTARISADDGSASKYPDLQLGNGSAGIVWFDERDGNQEIYASIAPLEVRDIEPHARRVTMTPGRSIGAYAAWFGDSLGIAWCDDSSGRNQIFFTALDAEGRVLKGTEQLSESAANHWVPAIQATSAGFAVLWSSGERASKHGRAAPAALTLRLVDMTPAGS